MALVTTLSEQERKDKLAEMTGGLKCRCPGYLQMNRVQFKGFDGIRYGYFACSEPGSTTETRYPIGYPGLCRCGLGAKANKVSTRYRTDDEATWGFSSCTTTAAGQSTVPAPVLAQQTQDEEEWAKPAGGVNLLLWGAVIGVTALVFTSTVRGKGWHAR